MKVGILALGSHHERHGAALPLDTDARIAEHIARKVSEKTGAEFIGVLDSAYELPEIDTGKHQSLAELKSELKRSLEEAKKEGFESVVIVNAHGGNQEIDSHLSEIEKEAGVNLEMDSKVCQIEGPHAGAGELSMGALIGITDESKIGEHGELKNHPELASSGFEEARKKYEWAEEHAREVIEDGVEIDEDLGEKLIRESVESSVEKIKEMRSSEK